MKKETETLSFEEFKSVKGKVPPYNNFINYFVNTSEMIDFDSRRTNSEFLALKEERPLLENELTQNITNSFISSRKKKCSLVSLIQPYEKELYEAYLFMRLLVSQNYDLFG